MIATRGGDRGGGGAAGGARVAPSAFAMAALLLLACKATPPDVDREGGDDLDAGPPFADIVVAFTDAEGVPRTCTDSLPVCVGDGADAGVRCGPTELLGPPDGVTYDLVPGGIVEIGLLCSHIIERGGAASADLKVWSTLGERASLVVDVTFDGTSWVTLGAPTTSDVELDLQRTELEIVRFIRLTSSGSGPVAIDAVEALR